MNKLKVSSNEIFLKDEDYIIEKEGKLIINVEGLVNIKDINSKVCDYIINLSDKAVLNYYKYNDLEKNEKIVINSNNNSTINYYYSLLCSKFNKIDVLHNINGSNNKSNINIRVVTEEYGTSNIIANSKVTKDTIDNEINENIKLLKLNDNESIIQPNLEIDSHEITANHSATISEINDKELFYLTSKGLAKDSAIKLLKEGFINKNIEILKIYE